MTADELRAGIWDAVRERQKLVATEALTDMDSTKAVAELAKYFGPSASRGDTVLELFASALTFGDREKLRLLFDGALRPGVQSVLEQIGHLEQKQIGLFDAQVTTIETLRGLRRRLEEAVAREEAGFDADAGSGRRLKRT